MVITTGLLVLVTPIRYQQADAIIQAISGLYSYIEVINQYPCRYLSFAQPLKWASDILVGT